MTRRDLLRSTAGVAAMSAAQAIFPGVLFAAPAPPPAPPADLSWPGKTPCRFCGVGCGLLVGIRRAGRWR